MQTMANLIDFIPGWKTKSIVGKDIIVMDTETFTPFLFQMIPVIRLLDMDILLPKSLQNILKPKPSVKGKKQNQENRFSI